MTVYEVGPRDGLQNESSLVTADAKARYIDMLSDAGLPAIEATSFVHPRAVPQLADAAEVLAKINRKPGTRYPVLVPNEQGMKRALEAGAHDIALFTAASEGFARANINCTVEESLERFEPVVHMAHDAGVRVRAYVSTAFGCPFDGPVSESNVRDVTLRLLKLGAVEVSISDTIGVATPGDVVRVLDPLLRDVPAGRLAVHFHDTRGTALANVLEALRLGISTVDASSAGLGGCPYAPGASGNLATEDLVYMLHGMGIETGVDLDKLVAASHYILSQLDRAPGSRYVQAGPTSAQWRSAQSA